MNERTYTPGTMDGAELTPLGRFEKVCEAYLNATREQQAAALALLPDDQKKTFLEGCGLYHLLTDQDFYRRACQAMAGPVYRGLHERRD